MYVFLEHFLAKQINEVIGDIEYIALHILGADFFCWFMTLLNSIFLMIFAARKYMFKLNKNSIETWFQISF